MQAVILEARAYNAASHYVQSVDRSQRRRDTRITLCQRQTRAATLILRQTLTDRLAAVASTTLTPSSATALRLAVDQAVDVYGRRLTLIWTAAASDIAHLGYDVTPKALVAARLASPPTRWLTEAALPDPVPVPSAFPESSPSAAEVVLRDLRSVIFIPMDPQVERRLIPLLVEEVIRITDTARSSLRRILARGVAGETTLAPLLQQVRELLATQPNRITHRLGTLTAQAERIVRTELLGIFAAANQARSLQVQQNVPDLRKYWRSAHDPRVRDDHRSADRRYAPGSSPGPIPATQDFIIGGERAQYPHDPRLSASQTIHCFVGSTIVSGPGIERAYDRFYEGEIVTLHTASGDKLTGSPNHPVLTDQGWIPLGCLHESMHIVRCLDHGRMASSYPDVFNCPTPIGEIAHTLADTYGAKRVYGVEVDFHGDGCNSDISVVSTNSELWDTRVPAGSQETSEFLLPSADVLPALLTSQSESGEMLLGHWLSSERLPCGGSEQLTLVGSQCAHADPIRVGNATKADVSENKASSNNWSRGAICVGKRGFGLASEIPLDDSTVWQVDVSRANLHACSDEMVSDCGFVSPVETNERLERFSSLIAFDDITHVERRWFSGHVFNLETDTGWYIANNIIVHNCRCIRVEYHPDWFNRGETL